MKLQKKIILLILISTPLVIQNNVQATTADTPRSSATLADEITRFPNPSSSSNLPAKKKADLTLLYNEWKKLQLKAIEERKTWERLEAEYNKKYKNQASTQTGTTR